MKLRVGDSVKESWVFSWMGFCSGCLSPHHTNPTHKALDYLWHLPVVEGHKHYQFASAAANLHGIARIQFQRYKHMKETTVQAEQMQSPELLGK